MKPKCFSFAAADTKKIRLRSLLKEVIINLSKSCTKTRLLCRAGGQT
ncbi:MAG: sulfide/dihydroorotate dehydrogenase-like FAD/NAD-binding protein, partial [Faecalibacterium sp.]|nr:sulfide/dihydroorotate dehydrogenase-like FAD/NAD-binding protein [Faecalibacterium sp.]